MWATGRSGMRRLKHCRKSLDELGRGTLGTSRPKAVEALEMDGGPGSRSLGQPSPFTHPYLLRHNEVTFGITKLEFSERRQRLLEMFAQACSSLSGDSRSNGQYLILVPAAKLVYSAPDVPYSFRQDSNFLYLTGFQEPGSVLAIYNPSPGSLNHCSVLFVADRDPHKELWDGPLAGVDGAVELTGVDVSMTHSEFPQFLKGLASDSLGSNSSTLLSVEREGFPEKDRSLLEDLVFSQVRFSGIKPVQLIHKLRWVKSLAERDLMRRTCEIGSAGLKETMRFSRGWMSENCLVGKMDLESKLGGAQGLAYPPVVAGGERANIIHYLFANQILDPEKLVLMDAGCDFHGYVSDITRTWPVAKTFTSDPQRCLYEALAEIQTDLLSYVANVRPLVLSDLQQKMEILIGRQFQRLGLLDSSLEGKDLIKEAEPYCPHHVSHYLGMDVHDTGSVSRTLKVRPGVCITVEPGMYIPASDTRVPLEYRGIGMRIEDDVLITESGAEILTENCPKDAEKLLELLES